MKTRDLELRAISAENDQFKLREQLKVLNNRLLFFSENAQSKQDSSYSVHSELELRADDQSDLTLRKSMLPQHTTSVIMNYY